MIKLMKETKILQQKKLSMLLLQNNHNSLNNNLHNKKESKSKVPKLNLIFLKHSFQLKEWVFNYKIQFL
jgi:hypothetical protein